jgi:hypothetical protein
MDFAEMIIRPSSESSLNKRRDYELVVEGINYENYHSTANLEYFLRYILKLGFLTFLGLFAFFVSGIDFDDEISFTKEEPNYTTQILRVSKNDIDLCNSTDVSEAPSAKGTNPPIIEVTYFESDVLEYPTGPSPPVFISAA